MFTVLCVNCLWLVFRFTVLKTDCALEGNLVGEAIAWCHIPLTVPQAVWFKLYLCKVSDYNISSKSFIGLLIRHIYKSMEYLWELFENSSGLADEKTVVSEKIVPLATGSACVWGIIVWHVYFAHHLYSVTSNCLWPSIHALVVCGHCNKQLG